MNLNILYTSLLILVSNLIYAQQIQINEVLHEVNSTEQIISVDTLHFVSGKDYKIMGCSKANYPDINIKCYSTNYQLIDYLKSNEKIQELYVCKAFLISISPDQLKMDIYIGHANSSNYVKHNVLTEEQFFTVCLTYDISTSSWHFDHLE